MSLLKEEIQALAETLEQKISNDDLSGMADLLNHYTQMIEEYITTESHQKQAFYQALSHFQVYHNRAIQLLQEKQLALQNTLFNVNQLKAYVGG